jgi:transposase InsO family protein
MATIVTTVTTTTLPLRESKPSLAIVGTKAKPGMDGGLKGVYHINAVDEVTQWEVVGATPQISEAWLIPVLEAMLVQFLFAIRGFHSDCGSEFINYRVAGLLNKLLIEQTKSRPRRSNDNGLVEEKWGGGAKTHGTLAHCRATRRSDWGVLPGAFQSVSELSPSVWSSRDGEGGEGQTQAGVSLYATPWQILRQLPGVAGHLRAGITIAGLDARAAAESDTEAARRMQQAKRRLFTAIEAAEKRTA